jgi:hypothetical protein
MIIGTFVKVCRIGKVDGHQTYIKISYQDGRLSITGVVGPMRNGDCRGSCGQIVMSGLNVTEYAPGWDAESVAKLTEFWNRWHLNEMRAGSPAQERFLRENPVKAIYPESHYDVACKALAQAGLNPDPETGYKYGTAWLREEVPADVLEWLASRPDTDHQPAWV